MLSPSSLLPLLVLLPTPGLAAAVKPETPIANADRAVIPKTQGRSFTRDFAPAEGWVNPLEAPQRKELCLNGRWNFQPVPLPSGFQRDAGNPPALPPPTPNGWEATPIKIPSPWNVNTWGGQRISGAGSNHPYDPSALYYPSYPASWDGVEMGWLRRSFRVPADWGERRIVLHFEAVAGDCQVLINGHIAGSHFDKYLPFELDVTQWVHRYADNELLIGVRAHSLFNKRSLRYPKMRAPYPTGSETERLVGIWQDVFLLGLPPIRVEDVFIKPLVDQDVLELEVTLRNDTEREQSVTLGGDVSPWLNLAGNDTLSAPEPKWMLGPVAMTLPIKQATLKPGETITVILSEPAKGRLKFWTPDTPSLYTTVLSLTQEGRTLDRRSARFGWRQFKIAGPDLLLNGAKIQLHADLLHPFGPYILSRRYAWAWYKMIKEMGGNAVRPHAQIHPRHYLDLADEMGIVVLDETALFGSSIALNFEEPAAWQRFGEHFDGLIMRDRNHPSVVGWSFGNELFAIFNLNGVSPADSDRWYKQLTELGRRALKLDPTREWISCDGDEDLRGTLPVWSRHFGLGNPANQLPDLNKPLMVGESGGTYYATPAQLSSFNGDRAYASYTGRSEALAIDVYDNIVKMALPRLTYYSASEMAWFGIEHLPFGYHDFTRLPDDHDGVFFTMPFQEGKPGMQPERLPPYAATLNPGWDPTLPLYKPLPMFEAEKAALAKGGPRPSPWDHPVKVNALPLPPTTLVIGDVLHELPTPPPMIKSRFSPLAFFQGEGLGVRSVIREVGFIGDRAGGLFNRLSSLGVPFSEPGAPSDLLIVDGDALDLALVDKAAGSVNNLLNRGGSVLILLQNPAATATVNQLLPLPVELTGRTATALVSHGQDSWVSGLRLPDLYFAEEPQDGTILKHGLAGPFVAGGQVLLEASNTDWALFNNRPETVKCAAVLLYEALEKPGGASLVERTIGKGTLALCSVDWRLTGRTADALWRKLLSNRGVQLHEARPAATAAFDDKNALVNALSIGRFGAVDVNGALTTDFLHDTLPQPGQRPAPGGPTWAPVVSPSRDRFMLNELQQTGPTDAFAVYFSYWIKSPRALDDILTAGPDAPRLTTLCFASEKCRLFLNGRELQPVRAEPADYRTLYTFDGIPLKKGWNHILIKVASGHLTSDHPATLAVRLMSSSADFLQQLETAIDHTEQ